MSVLRELRATLAKMFVADAVLTLGLLGVAGMAALIARPLHAPAAAAAILLAGAVGVLLLAILRSAGRQPDSGGRG